MTAPDDEAPRRPILRVVKGDPTPEELAALIAVVSARASAAGEPEPTSVAAYAAPAAGHRQPFRIGPGAWVASGWTAGTRTRADW